MANLEEITDNMLTEQGHLNFIYDPGYVFKR